MLLNTPRLHFISDALNATGGFRPVVSYDYTTGRATEVQGLSYLVKYPREGDDKFARRNEVAWYVNDLKSSCMRFVGYLARRPPARDLPNPLLEALQEDANWRGDDLDTFWQGFMVDAKARGVMFLLVDMPRTLPGSQAEQVEARAFPYLVSIKPENVTKIDVDDRGQVSMVEVQAGMNEGRPIVRGWDSERWWVKAGDKEIDGDTHPLGVCPVLAFSEGEIGQDGEFTQIADISRRLFNLRSELDEILRAQTFSLLTYHVPSELSHTFNAASVAEAIGTHNMLVHHGDLPAFIAPPDGPAKIYLDTIEMLEQRIRDISLNVELSQRQESGISLALRFQALNSSLTFFARRMEDLERRAFGIACRWLGINDNTSTSWSKDYAIADIKVEIETAMNLQLLGAPPEYQRAKLKQIAALDMSEIEEEDMNVILDAIDGMGKEIMPPDHGEGQTTPPPTDQQATADMSGIESRLDAIENAITAQPAPVAPNINITVPKQDAPVVNIAPAQITVEAPVVNVMNDQKPTSKTISKQADGSITITQKH